MLIKVCGIKYQHNLDKVSQLDIDMIGLNFYEDSSRYLEDVISVENTDKELVGVFVNASIESIMDLSHKYNLTYIQLHGNESPEYCKLLGSRINVIKAFSIQGIEDFEDKYRYE